MTLHADGKLIFLIEDWRPAAPELGSLLTELGFRVEVMPNILDLVSKRMRRDRPGIMVVNASSLLIGDDAQWRRFLSGTAAIVVVPDTATASFFERAHGLGFCGLLDPPVSREKLALVLEMAFQNRRAAQRLRLATHRLQTMQQRLVGVHSAPATVASPAGIGGNGGNAGNGGSSGSSGNGGNGDHVSSANDGERPIINVIPSCETAVGTCL